MMPVLVGTGIISDSSALIQWTVPSIAYTTETYVVEYGTSQDSLDMTSDPTHSGEDITIANVTFSVTLLDLRENTTYYVHIVATNTAGRSTTSSVQRFMTSLADLGNFLIAIIRHFFCSNPMHAVEFATRITMLWIYAQWSGHYQLMSPTYSVNGGR